MQDPSTPTLVSPHRHDGPMGPANKPSKQKSVLKLTGPTAPVIQALAARHPEVARRLVTWTPSYVHALAIALQSEAVAERGNAIAAFDDPVVRDASTLTLLTLAGFEPADRLIPLLNQLQTTLYRIEEYRAWARMMAHKRAAGFIGSHRGKLTAAKLNALSILHPDLYGPRIMANIRSHSDVVAVNVIVEAVRRACPDVAICDIRRSLRQTKGEFNVWLRSWFARGRLPDPPYPGSDRLVPLRTGREVVDAGRTFQNCLADQVDQAATGQLAYYVWKGREPAVIALKPLGKFGWVLDEIAGPKNKKLSTATRRAITAELTSWGCFADGKVEDAVHRWRAWSLL